MPEPAPTLVWLRNDLRLADNPALANAASGGGPVICLYILEDDTNGMRPLGAAAKWWLHESLVSLSRSIEQRGATLILRRGDAREIIPQIVEEAGARRVVWNRRYEKPGRDLDADLKAALKEAELEVESFNASLLTEPWTLETTSGGYYKVFTPYWRALRSCYRAPDPIPAPESLTGPRPDSDMLEDWQLQPASPDWARAFPKHWTPGEAGASARLETFLDGPIDGYEDDRNRPDREWSTSGLSPHLRWGEIGPVQVWREVMRRIEDGRFKINEGAAMTFLSEIAWREFSYVLLFHNPKLASANYNQDFDKMPWRSNASELKAWQAGRTGYPIVDAGMRQLWTIGWMHNRVRMITASLLTKHLLIHWSKGEDWFWDTLVDADTASNAAGWQWVAGSGADASPYFRVFNPITQGEKFDVTGDYVRTWCPELKDLPDKHLFAPWEAPESVLKSAGVKLGETYPHPLIEHKPGRQRALEAYETLKERRADA